MAQHDGCFFCGSTADEVLQSKAFYKVISKKGESLAPASVALCSSPDCQRRDEIDHRTLAGDGMFARK